MHPHPTHRCIVCDRAENYDQLKEYYKDTPVDVVRNGHFVSRKADFIIYSVEAEFIDRVVAEYGACMFINDFMYPAHMHQPPK